MASITLLCASMTAYAADEAEPAGPEGAAEPASSEETSSDAASTTPMPVVHATLGAALEASSRDGAMICIVFGAQWCDACKLLDEHALPDLLKDTSIRILHVVSIDIDADEALARAYRIHGVPTLVLVTAEQKIVTRHPGLMTSQELIEWIQEGRKRAALGLWEGTAPDEKLAASIPDGRTPEGALRAAEMLGDADPANQASVLAALAERRDDAVPVVLAGLRHDYLGVRVGASELLRHLAPTAPAANPWAAKAVRDERVVEIEQWWEETGRLPERPEHDPASPLETRAIDSAIVNALSDDPVRRTEAMSTLVRIGETALPFVREAMAQRAAAGDRGGVHVLEDVRWAVRVPYSVELKAHVRRDLARGTSEERQAAVGRLKGGGEVLPALRELLGDPDPLVRESVVHALLRVGGNEALEAMATLLKAEDTNLRMVAAQALGQSKNKKAGKYLAEAVKDADELVACVAIAAIEEVGAKGQADALIECLDDERWRVRAAAAKALGDLELKKGAEKLKELLEDEDPFVIKSAFVALREMRAQPSTEEMLALAKRQPDLLGPVVATIARSEDKKSLTLIEKLYDEADEERRGAIVAALAPEYAYYYTSRRDDAHWKPFLTTIAAEESVEIRRHLPRILGVRSVKLTEPFIADLLQDADALVRSSTAALVLRAAYVDFGGGGSEHEHIVSSGVFSGPTAREGGRTPRRVLLDAFNPKTIMRHVKYRQWHTLIGDTLDETPGAVYRVAYYVTGDPRADLPVLDQAFSVEEAKRDLELSSANFTGRLVMQRLPWPESREFVAGWCEKPWLYALLLYHCKKANPELRAFLLDADQILAAVVASASSQSDFEDVAYPLLSGDSSGASLYSTEDAVRAIVERLHTADEPVARAMALFVMARRKDYEDPEPFEQALSDEHKWVRYWAAAGLAKLVTDQEEREEKLGPMLSDEQSDVARFVAGLLLLDELHGFDILPSQSSYFRFDELSVYAYYGSRSYVSSSSYRPVRMIKREPAFLPALRARFTKEVKSADVDAIAVYALLLAQYGDVTGLDVVLERWKEHGGDEAAQILAVGLCLTRNAKYLPPLREIAEKAESSYELREMLTYVRGVRGNEAREFRRFVNRRMRELD